MAGHRFMPRRVGIIVVGDAIGNDESLLFQTGKYLQQACPRTLADAGKHGGLSILLQRRQVQEIVQPRTLDGVRQKDRHRVVITDHQPGLRRNSAGPRCLGHQHVVFGCADLRVFPRPRKQTVCMHRAPRRPQACIAGRAAPLEIGGRQRRREQRAPKKVAEQRAVEAVERNSNSQGRQKLKPEIIARGFRVVAQPAPSARTRHCRCHEPRQGLDVPRRLALSLVCFVSRRHSRQRSPRVMDEPRHLDIFQFVKQGKHQACFVGDTNKAVESRPKIAQNG